MKRKKRDSRDLPLPPTMRQERVLDWLDVPVTFLRQAVADGELTPDIICHNHVRYSTLEMIELAAKIAAKKYPARNA